MSCATSRSTRMRRRRRKIKPNMTLHNKTSADQSSCVFSWLCCAEGHEGRRRTRLSVEPAPSALSAHLWHVWTDQNSWADVDEGGEALMSWNVSIIKLAAVRFLPAGGPLSLWSILGSGNRQHVLVYHGGRRGGGVKSELRPGRGSSGWSAHAGVRFRFRESVLKAEVCVRTEMPLLGVPFSLTTSWSGN